MTSIVNHQSNHINNLRPKATETGIGGGATAKRLDEPKPQSKAQFSQWVLSKAINTEILQNQIQNDCLTHFSSFECAISVHL